MAPLKSNTSGGNRTHNLRKGVVGANHTHNLRKIAGRATNTQKILNHSVPKRKKLKAKAAKKVSRFLELPREIRDMIYDLAMRVDGVLAPYAEKDDIHFLDSGGQVPNVALLRVNKQVREEATLRMMRVNTWRITMPNEIRRGNLWYSHVSQITDVVVSYLPWDGNPSKAQELAKLNDIHSNPRYFDTHSRRDALHQWRLDRMKGSWIARRRPLSYFDNLKILTIDTTYLMCRSGCCRLAMMRQLFNHSYLSSPGRNVDVRVLGVRDVGEWNLVHTWRYLRVAVSDRESAKLTAPSVWCVCCSSFGEKSGYDSRCSICHSRVQHLTEASSQKEK